MTAAAIGVGGIVIVGVAGFSAAIWNTRKAIAHVRESKLWDRPVQIRKVQQLGLQWCPPVGGLLFPAAQEHVLCSLA
jgi:hypothetical protein